MTIAEILRYKDITSYAPYAPYIYTFFPSTYLTASWWEDITTDTVKQNTRCSIPECFTAPNDELSSLDSIGDMSAQESSFYFDKVNQILYIHYPSTFNPWSQATRYGKVQGYTNNDTVIYIDDVIYNPLLLSVPSISKSEDLASYDKLAFISGDYTFDNSNGDFDDLINEDIYANRVYAYYMPNKSGTYDFTKSDMTALASYYVENYEYSLSEFTVTAQDLRKAQSISLPEFAFGTIASKDATSLTDDDGPVKFSICANITDIGIVEEYDEDTDSWFSVPPYNVNLEEGTFWLLPSDCRSGDDDDGSINDIRVRNFVGVVNSSALDVIEWINEKQLGIKYTASNYDLTQWKYAKTIIHNIAGIIDADTKTFDAIEAIQKGSNVGFRYDITADGKRTILLDDWTKTPVKNITNVNIKNNLEIPISTDSDLISGIIKINYAYNNSNDKYKTYTYDHNYTDVYNRYRTAPTTTLESSFITNEADAIQKAEQLADRYAYIEKIASPELHGSQYYGLNIYDMLTIDFSTDSRTYWGKWLCQVIGTEVNTDEIINTVDVVLVEQQ